MALRNIWRLEEYSLLTDYAGGLAPQLTCHKKLISKFLLCNDLIYYSCRSFYGRICQFIKMSVLPIQTASNCEMSNEELKHG